MSHKNGRERRRHRRDVSSGAARLGSPGEYVDDAASKGALDTFTIGLAREVAEEGIRVNAVRPGKIKAPHASEVGKSEPRRNRTFNPQIKSSTGRCPLDAALSFCLGISAIRRSSNPIESA
jgi:NAD(P)-dependent dehydrogenase (short-subunit alcohol dehydrogenase family)